MGLRDLINKKNGLSKDDRSPTEAETIRRINGPEFNFIRTDTIASDQGSYFPPSDNSRLTADPERPTHLLPKQPSIARRSLEVVFHPNRSRSASTSSQASNRSNTAPHRRLSQRLHLSRAPASSENVPENLPAIVVPPATGSGFDGSGADGDSGDGSRAAAESTESQWEKRATMLAEQNERMRISRSPSPTPGYERPAELVPRVPSPGNVVSSKQIDADIQEAIKLHEQGDLEQSTRLFGRLADPNGANNPLSQVLYGLALRHGWGCTEDPARAVQYLSAAASNAASIEELALQAGLKKGGAAKGELVLAIFELANCFRHGWGIPKDPVAAKQYYETAANLGDTDAMNEVALCYLEGYGCKKDKYAAARYYRLAENAGSKTLGNSWIWKDKYDPPSEGSKK